MSIVEVVIFFVGLATHKLSVSDTSNCCATHIATTGDRQLRLRLPRSPTAITSLINYRIINWLQSVSIESMARAWRFLLHIEIVTGIYWVAVDK